MLSALRYRLALLALGAVWLVVRAFYWNGYYTEDAPGYVTDAIWMALGSYHARDYVNGLNVGTYLPVALPIWILGKSEIALGLWPLASSLLGFLSIAGLARILFGPPFGLLAAFLWATYPGDVFFSTVVMPDAVQAGWLTFSLFLVAAGHLPSNSRQRVTLAAAGMAAGMCHLIRANDVLLVPVGVCAVAVFSRVWTRRAWVEVASRCGVYLSGFLLVLCAEGVAYLWTAQDFFLRLHVVHQHYGTPASIARAGLNTDPRTIPFSALAPLSWWIHGTWGQLNQDQAYHALTFCWAAFFLPTGLVALGALRGRVCRRAIAGFGVAVVWLLWPLLYQQFGSQSLTSFVPMHRLSRHLVAYAPGAMFMTVAGCFLGREVCRATGVGLARRLLASTCVAVLLVHTYFNWRAEQIAYDSFHQLENTYQRIREHLPRGVKTLIADPGDLCFFDFWLNPLGLELVKMVPFAAYSSCDEIQDGVVITRSNPGWEGKAPAIQEAVGRLPCLLTPPATWQLVYDGYPESVFQVLHREGDARD